jgi:nucleotide-binding universal stress UspA family protein
VPFVVGYDDSAGSRRALEVALELAKPIDEQLVIAFASQPPVRSVGEEHHAHLAAVEEQGRALVDAAVAEAQAAGVAAEAVVAAEKPVDLLLELADERRARLIIVGTYGESPLRGAVLGSTPHKLLHLSRVPVLAVPG